MSHGGDVALFPLSVKVKTSQGSQRRLGYNSSGFFNGSSFRFKHGRMYRLLIKSDTVTADGRFLLLKAPFIVAIFCFCGGRRIRASPPLQSVSSASYSSPRKASRPEAVRRAKIETSFYILFASLFFFSKVSCYGLLPHNSLPKRQMKAVCGKSLSAFLARGP